MLDTTVDADGDYDELAATAIQARSLGVIVVLLQWTKPPSTTYARLSVGPQQADGIWSFDLSPSSAPWDLSNPRQTPALPTTSLQHHSETMTTTLVFVACWCFHNR